MVGPVGGYKLFAGVCPGVGIVEVEHELHAGIFYLSAELCHVGDVLAYALALTFFGGFVGIDKESHTRGIPTVFLEKMQGIDCIAVGVAKDRAFLLILREHRYVGTQETLRFFLCH